MSVPAGRSGGGAAAQLMLVSICKSPDRSQGVQTVRSRRATPRDEHKVRGDARAILIVFALAALGAAPAGAVTRLVHFKSPSGNLNCIGGTSPVFVECLAKKATWPSLRARPANCDLDWIPADLSLGSRRVIIGSCRGDVGPMCFKDCTTLRYGKSVNIGPIRCRSAANGVTCRYVRGSSPASASPARATSSGARDARRRSSRARDRARARARPGVRRAGGRRTTASRAFPFENYDDLRDAGMLGLCIPERYGGMGAAFRDYMHIGADARAVLPDDGADATTCTRQTVLWTGIIADDLTCRPTERARHEAIRAELYRWILEDGAIMSQPLSEGIASGATAGVMTTATPVDGGFLVTGARSSPRWRARRRVQPDLRGAGRGGPALLQCRADNPGVRSPATGTRSACAAPTRATLVFEDAFVPADDELLPAGLFDQLADALALRLHDADADLRRAHASGRRLRAGVPRRRPPPGFRRAATARPSSGAGPRSRSPGRAQPRRLGARRRRGRPRPDARAAAARAGRPLHGDGDRARGGREGDPRLRRRRRS